MAQWGVGQHACVATNGEWLVESENSLVNQQSVGNPYVNLAHPELELTDPTPNLHQMFIQFDQRFFWSKLCGRTIVKWSKRMYSCAGTCSYGMARQAAGAVYATITLSEPLLKLRPRKNLVETLLHEMIHAYCFITKTGDRTRSGHGPTFQAHMLRINGVSGLNITIYHDFHDEVMLYKSHWWRCDGICQTRGPYFGIVKRSSNRPPGPYDYSWKHHQATCGGTYTKIKQPEKYTGKTNGIDTNNNKADIVNIINNVTNLVSVTTQTDYNPDAGPVLKDFNINTIKTTTKEGQTNGSDPQKSFFDTAEAATKAKTITNTPNAKKHKAADFTDTPPAKTKKIDDIFPKVSAMIKDLYGDDIAVIRKNGSILLSVAESDLADCPICKTKVNSQVINAHIDECLNKDIIDILSKEDKQTDVGNKRIKTDIGKVWAVIETDNQVNIELTVKIEPGSNKDSETITCACCGDAVYKSMDEHLDECLSFFGNKTMKPNEGASTSFTNDFVVNDDDDDILNESATFNATGTKYLCPCCFEMIEATEMNTHLDDCLC